MTKNFNIAYFSLFPLLLISGPLIPEISIFFGLVYFFYKRKDLNINLNSYKNIYLYFLIFYFFIVILSIINFIELKTLVKNIAYIRFLFFSYFIYLILQNINSFKSCMKIWNIGFFLIFLDVVYQLIFLEDIFGYKVEMWRFSGPFGEEQILGSYIFFFLTIYSSTFFLDKEKNIFILDLIFISSIVLIFLSGERKTIILSTTYFLFYLLFIRRNLLLIFVMLLLLVGGFFNVKTNLPGVYNRVVVNTYEQIFSNKNIYIFSKSYHNLYKTGFNLGKENFPLGTGPKNYRHKCKETLLESKCSTHPHNLMLQLFIEMGFIGVIFYFVGYLFFFMEFIKNLFKKNSNKSLSLILSSLLLWLMPLSSFGNFFNNFLSMQFYFLIGLYLFVRSKETN